MGPPLPSQTPLNLRRLPRLGWRCGAFGQAVGSDGSIVPALGGLRHKAPAGPCAEAGGAHQAADPTLPVAVPAGAQGTGQARPAIGAPALLKGVLQLFGESGILALAAARSALPPAVITTPRNAQQRAAHRHGMCGGQVLEFAVAGRHGIERMPNDFFRICQHPPVLPFGQKLHPLAISLRSVRAARCPGPVRF